MDECERAARAYELHLLAYRPPESVDRTMLSIMEFLHSHEPRLLFFYGDDDRRVVKSPRDFPAARKWLSGPSDASGATARPDLALLVGFDVDEQSPNLLQVMPAEDGGLLWRWMLWREDIEVLAGEPPRAAQLFRSLVRIVRPYRGDWTEFRHRVLILCGHEYEDMPPWFPSEYPRAAIPPGWIRPNSAFHYPDGLWWFNYWGPELVELAGIDILRSMPVKHFEELDDGCMFWLCDELFTIDNDEHLAAQREVLEYLDSRGVLQRFGLR